MHHFNKMWLSFKIGGVSFLNATVPDKRATGYYNAYEKLRDSSHNWIYPLVRLQAMVEQAGFQVQATRQLSKEMEFHQWVDRQQGKAA